MSATNRGATRKAYDFYPTPPESFIPMFAEFRPWAFTSELIWLEPCRGDSRIFNMMPEGFREWAEIREGRDYLAKPYPADIGMTNVPFSIALEFVVKMLRECKTVAVMQRLGWLGSKDRRPFWQENPPTHLFPLAERPSFTKELIEVTFNDLFENVVEIGGENGTDSADYAWYVWDGLGVMKRPPGVYVL